MDAVIIIPAIKKNVAFTDDLVKKLDGKSLIQRAVDKAGKLVNKEDIYVVTDSEEISLICKRNSVNVSYKKNLRFKPQNIIENLHFLFSELSKNYKELILLSPYAPLLQEESVEKALKEFRLLSKPQTLIPVKREISRIFKKDKRDFKGFIMNDLEQELLIESQAFKIFSSCAIQTGIKAEKVTPLTFEVSPDLVEIRSYQDWWVCEKLLKRKRIIFRVVSDEQLGMGHIYRALTLAHEITDHEVRFVCDENSNIAVTKLAGYDYWLGVYKEEEIEDRIIQLKPDLVINDILKTSQKYICKLKSNGIKVVNYEDIGSGAKYADLTINEIFDIPRIPGENICWGKDYFFLREEFNEAKPISFKKKVRNILITFGGTDQKNYTGRIFSSIIDFCREENIKIFIVVGGGNMHVKGLEKEIKGVKNAKIEFTYATGVISHIMEKVDIAITSNGRTVYELAHLNIPSIVLSQHERENTHSLAKKKNGFIPLGLDKGVKTERRALLELKKLVGDMNFRRTCFDRLKPLRFAKNKKKVVKKILNLLDSPF